MFRFFCIEHIETMRLVLVACFSRVQGNFTETFSLRPSWHVGILLINQYSFCPTMSLSMSLGFSRSLCRSLSATCNTKTCTACVKTQGKVQICTLTHTFRHRCTHEYSAIDKRIKQCLTWFFGRNKNAAWIKSAVTYCTITVISAVLLHPFFFNLSVGTVILLFLQELNTLVLLILV